MIKERHRNMSNSIWDSPAIQVVEDYVKFEKVGDRFAGKLIKVNLKTFPAKADGTIDTAPELTLVSADGEEKILTAGARNLKASLIEKRPNPGDWVEVVLTSETPIGGGRSVRGWEVTVTPAATVTAVTEQAPVTPASLGATPVATGVDPAVAAAAVAALSPEQRALLGLG